MKLFINDQEFDLSDEKLDAFVKFDNGMELALYSVKDQKELSLMSRLSKDDYGGNLFIVPSACNSIDIVLENRD